MITQELVGFIKGQLQKGIPEATIRTQLLSGGWSALDLDEAFRSILGPATVPVPAGVPPVVPTNPTPGVATNLATPAPKWFLWAGLAGLLVSSITPILFLSVFAAFLPAPISTILYAVVAGIFTMLFVEVAILHGYTKVFHIANSSWKRAIFMIGVPGAVSVILSFATSSLAGTSSASAGMSLILSILLVIGWCILFMKVYKAGFLKAFGIGFLTVVTIAVAAVVLMMIAGFGGAALKVSSIKAQLEKNPPTTMINEVGNENSSMMQRDFQSGTFSGSGSSQQQALKYLVYNAQGFSFKYEPAFVDSITTEEGANPSVYKVVARQQFQDLFNGGDVSLWLVDGPIPTSMNCSASVARQITINDKEFNYCDSQVESSRLYYYSKNGKTLIIVVTNDAALIDVGSVEIN